MCLGRSVSSIICHVGMAAPRAPVAGPPGTLPSHSPQLPSGCRGRDREGREAMGGWGGEEAGEKGRRRGGWENPSSPACAVETLPSLSLHPDSALCPAHSRCSVSVVELSQVYLGNQVSEEEK